LLVLFLGGTIADVDRLADEFVPQGVQVQSAKPRLTRKVEIVLMRTSSPEEIVINGVRYNLSIRVETRWRYHAEWWNASGPYNHTPDDRVRLTSEAERQASDEIQRARLKQEPWLCAEIACAEGEEIAEVRTP